MTEYQLGDVKIEVREAFTTTRFPDGKLTVADHSVQPTQEEMAAALGMTVQEMNETHDLTHSLFAHPSRPRHRHRRPLFRRRESRGHRHPALGENLRRGPAGVGEECISHILPRTAESRMVMEDKEAEAARAQKVLTKIAEREH